MSKKVGFTFPLYLILTSVTLIMVVRGLMLLFNDSNSPAHTIYFVTHLTPILLILIIVMFTAIFYKVTKEKMFIYLSLIILLLVTLLYISFINRPFTKNYLHRYKDYAINIFSSDKVDIKKSHKKIDTVSNNIFSVSIDLLDLPEQTTLRAGDSLWKISYDLYQDPDLWEDIFQQNQDEIDFLANGNPLIYPGQVISIPISNLSYENLSPEKLFTILESEENTRLEVVGINGTQIYIASINNSSVLTLTRFELTDPNSLELIDETKLESNSSSGFFNYKLIDPNILAYSFSNDLNLIYLDTLETIQIKHPKLDKYDTLQYLDYDYNDGKIVSTLMIGEGFSRNQGYAVVEYDLDPENLNDPKIVQGYVAKNSYSMQNKTFQEIIYPSYFNNEILVVDSDVGVWKIGESESQTLYKQDDCVFGEPIKIKDVAVIRCTQNKNSNNQRSIFYLMEKTQNEVEFSEIDMNISDGVLVNDNNFINDVLIIDEGMTTHYGVIESGDFNYNTFKFDGFDPKLFPFSANFVLLTYQNKLIGFKIK